MAQSRNLTPQMIMGQVRLKNARSMKKNRWPQHMENQQRSWRQLNIHMLQWNHRQVLKLHLHILQGLGNWIQPKVKHCIRTLVAYFDALFVYGLF